MSDFHRDELNEILNGNSKVNEDVEFLSYQILHVDGGNGDGIVVDGRKVLSKQDLWYK